MARRTNVPKSTSDLLEVMRVEGDLDLDDHDPGETFGWEKEAAKTALAEEIGRLGELQMLLFAEGKRSVLVVLQAMDAGGKDGVLRDVMTGLNPAGVEVTSFGVPTEEELAPRLPLTPKAFNRSHYERRGGAP